MQLLLVEKDSRMTSTYVERVFGFDRDTRTAYLSDCNYSSSSSGRRGASWKKSMRVYAVRLHCIYNNSVNMRSTSCDVRDLLTFTVYGAKERSVQQQQQQQGKSHHDDASGGGGAAAALPDLRAYTPDTTVHAGRYVEGSEAHTPTREPVNVKDDEAFVARECAWRLRCASYGGLRDLYLRMRDALIADGLHAPVRGGLVAGVDPRNGLHLASLPLYLLRGLYCLRDAVLYTCMHGELIGRNEQATTTTTITTTTTSTAGGGAASAAGTLVVLVKHAYLCLTDEWALVMTEDGKAVRWQPLQQLEAIEYCVADDKSSHSSGGSSSPRQQQQQQQQQQPKRHHHAASTFVALLASGDAPDVVFHVTDSFAPDATAPSLFAALPRSDAAGEVMRMLDVLRVLQQQQQQPQSPRPQRDGSDTSGSGSVVPTTLRVVPLASSSPSPSSGSATTTAPVTTVRGYVDRFAQMHTRALKWQALPGYADTHATLRSATALARALHVPQPQRQAVTRHAAFASYYDEQPPTRVDEALSGGSSGGGGSGSHDNNNNSNDGNDAVDVYAARPPKKKLSRLLQSLYPSEAMY